MRQQVLGHTTNYARKGEIPGLPDPLPMPHERASASVHRTERVARPPFVALASLSKCGKAAVDVKQIDTIDAALELKTQGYNPVVLRSI